MNWLLANSIVAVLLAGIALVASRWLRSWPAVAHALWLLVVLKLVTPPLFEVPIDVSWWGPAGVTTAPFVVPLEPSPGAALSMPVAARVLAIAPAIEPDLAPAAAPAIARASSPRLAATPSPGPSCPWWLLLWLTGSAVYVVATAVGVRRGFRHLRRLPEAPAALRHDVQMLADRLGVAVPTLLDDPSSASPYVWSLGRTRLVLPAALLLATTAKGRRAVLAHELAHLRRRDHWVAHLELLLAAVVWWHPLFWFARSRLRQWAELACDAWALASVPEATIDYARVLVDAVARPDNTVPGLTVLAARPAARAAFERRLTMILNENVHCRMSRAWWLPMTTMLLGLFAVPVAAQNEEPPAHVEVRVNGKSVDELSRSERRALLEQLLEAEQQGDAAPAPKAKATPRPKPKPKPKPKPEATPEAKPKASLRIQLDDPEGATDLGGLKDAMRQGLAEARAEIAGDKDLRELGITDEVTGLLDDLAAGKGIEGSIDQIIKAAMKGAGKVVVKELGNDPDLKELGLTDGITKLVTGLLENERNQEMLGDFVQHAMKVAMRDAKQEIRADADLQKLGITEDVEGLVDGILKGGDFEGALQRIMQKAMQSAGADVAPDAAPESDPAPEPEPKPKARKAKKNKGKDKDVGVLSPR